MSHDPSNDSLNFREIPDERVARSAYLFRSSTTWVAGQSVAWIHDHYPRKERLFAIWKFISLFLADGVSADLGKLSRVWYFPWTECQAEMEMAFAYAIGGMHRASADHARRALELVVVGAHFVAEHVTQEAAIDWMDSRGETPPFTRALKSLAKSEFAGLVLEQTPWRSSVQAHYWALSDIVHVRGQKFGIRKLQSSNISISGFPMVGFSPDRLRDMLDCLVANGEHICVALVLANPTLLVGLPIEAKFGIEPPSGFFTERLSGMLASFLPDDVRESIVALAQEYDRVKGMQAFLEGLPDMTPGEVAEQIRRYE